MNARIRPEQPLSLHFCETNTEKVIDQVFRAESDLGVIRIPAFMKAIINSCWPIKICAKPSDAV